jgi:hypothetical protein
MNEDNSVPLIRTSEAKLNRSTYQDSNSDALPDQTIIQVSQSRPGSEKIEIGLTPNTRRKQVEA